MFKKRSLIYTWILSYFLLLLVLILTCFMVVRNAAGVLTSEYKTITQNYQQRANSELGGYFTELGNSAYELSADYVINDYLFAPDPYGSKYYSLLPIQQKLEVHSPQSVNTAVRYLYMRNINRAISSETIYKYDELYDRLDIAGSLSAEDFLNIIAGYHYNDLVILDTNEGKRTILMLTSVPVTGRTPKGTIIQQIDIDSIYKMMRNNAAIEDSTTALLDGDHRLLCGFGEDYIANLLQDTALSYEGSEIVMEGKDYWIQQESITKAGWTLVTVVPMETIRRKAGSVLSQTLPVMLIMILFAAALCFLFIYQQWKSLHPIRQALKLEDKGTNEGNEYERVLRALTDARTSRDQIQSLWESKTNEMREEFLRSCLSSEVLYNQERLRKLLELLDIDFPGDWFAVFVLEYPEEISDPEGMSEGLREILENLPDDPVYQIYSFSYGDRWALILNAESGERVKELSSVLENLLGKAAQKYDGVLRYAVSSPRQDFINIHLACLEATGRLNNRNELSESGADSKPRFSAAQEELLYRYVAAGNAAEALDTLRTVLKENFRDERLPLSVCRCMAYSIVWKIMSLLQDIPDVWERQKETFYICLHELRHADSRQKLAEILESIISDSAAACLDVQEKSARSGEQPIEKILNCIQEHYRESDFNVSKAAELLGLSVPYLSNLFKRQTGIGMLSYINGLRIRYARKCILEDHFSVAQAAREVGIDNINTFIRLFKKYEGTTPGNIIEK